LAYTIDGSSDVTTLVTFTSSDSTNCPITYTLTDTSSNAYTTYSYITNFDDSNNQITVSSSSDSDAGTVNLRLTGTITGTSVTASDDFDLVLSVDCSSPTITSASQSDISYFISETQSDTTFNAFTISPSACTMTYTLTLSDDSAISNSALTFTASTPSLSVYSTDVNDAESMTLKLTATSDDNSGVSASETFTVDIIDCNSATITTSS
jgi:hypothetical protein